MTARQATFTRAAPDERRQSLIEATARCLAEKGAAGVSVRTICAEAGVSPGLLRHYFGGVSDAIAETYRWTGRQIGEALEAAVAQAGDDPRARLLAYLTASFRPPISTPELLATYIAFWSLTRSDPAIAAVRAEVYGDFRTGLEQLIGAYRPALADTRLASVALTALIDGLWLELSLGDAPFTQAEAEELAEKWLDSLLG
ncbi:TetR family transcriptional regulator C-terminal domain-containing protein [Altererythrobacter sp. CC-YST694]|uniref:TetR family transcriptional regulator C-terminal domain-containing protein n=1 Tax=Altererythrobacter sp. CC-YST694 TaxID=2755038 RepID=UPI001D035A5B|nr:TetR family transcriptional regulator C-terminal domain-containing protein [Altererythrobacter sp. CC-YST694]MCB5423849.1 TetR family transcriptional regulator C-terminal domain-containing protein [Altererythrobacter sp. CC-YST694]